MDPRALGGTRQGLGEERKLLPIACAEPLLQFTIAHDRGEDRGNVVETRKAAAMHTKCEHVAGSPDEDVAEPDTLRQQSAIVGEGRLRDCDTQQPGAEDDVT